MNLSHRIFQSQHKVLGYLSYEGPSPPAVEFGQLTSPRKSLVFAKLILFENYRLHCGLGNFIAVEIYL